MCTVEQQPQARPGGSAGKSLRLSDKREELPEGLEDVCELYAYGIKLQDIQVICTCRKLLLANLMWNEIRQIPSGLPLLLISLNLSHNNLCDLPSIVSSLASLPKLRDLHLKGNPFCLQSGYLQLVQTSLHALQYFDGNKVSWPTSLSAAQPAIAAIDSPAAGDDSPAHGHPQLQIVLSQLSVPNTVPGRLPNPDTASEPCPPLYYYYLQLCTADGGSLCSFPAVLTPQDELAEWQAAQAAEPVMATKKAAKKAPAAVKGSKADADAAQQRNAEYTEGSLSTVVPIAADVGTRNWMRSGIVMQLLRMRSPLSAPSQIAAQTAETADSCKLCQQHCVARGILQLSDLLDGYTKECNVQMQLATDVPLFDDKGIRLGLNSVSAKSKEGPSVDVGAKLTYTASRHLT